MSTPAETKPVQPASAAATAPVNGMAVQIEDDAAGGGQEVGGRHRRVGCGHAGRPAIGEPEPAAGRPLFPHCAGGRLRWRVTGSIV